MNKAAGRFHTACAAVPFAVCVVDDSLRSRADDGIDMVAQR
jgi:hypothetical protein